MTRLIAWFVECWRRLRHQLVHGLINEYSGELPPAREDEMPLPWGARSIWRHPDFPIEPPSGKLKIDLGAGDRKEPGFLGLDISPRFAPDIQCDLSKGIPLADDTVGHILARHILEHLPDLIFIMNELYRVCANGALVQIDVPHVDSAMAVADPTHRRYFSEESFHYFCLNGRHTRLNEAYGIHCRFDLMAEEIFRHRRNGYIKVTLTARKEGHA